MATLEVIGAGFGRTGTASLRAALDVLGYKTYHMTEVFANEMAGRGHLTFFEDAFARTPSRQPAAWYASKSDAEWRALLRDYTAVVDFPTTSVYKSLLRANANAKVILSTRSPHSWAESARDSIFFSEYIARHPLYWYGELWHAAVRATLGRVLPAGSFALMLPKVVRTVAKVFDYHLYLPAGANTRAQKRALSLRTAAGMANAVEQFRRWEADVKAHVPRAQLLVFHARDGWAPLCAFLGKPVPDAPFPHVNSREEWRTRVVVAPIVYWAPAVLGTLLLLAAAAALLYKYVL